MQPTHEPASGEPVRLPSVPDQVPSGNLVSLSGDPVLLTVI